MGWFATGLPACCCAGMPEGLEIEYYRRLAHAALDRTITAVDAPDDWYLKRGLTAPVIRELLIGRRFVADRRRGKLLLLDLDDGPTLGLRFGMTGKLEVDDRPAVEALQYASPRLDPAWVRFGVHFADGGSLRIRDPRRLGAVEIDPDEEGLGPDALSLTPAQLRTALAGSEAPLKARLMDQKRVAGLGNLLVDEILWRASLDPARPAGSLDDREARRLHRHLRQTLDQLLERGGSHMGDLMPARARGTRCPRCGGVLERRTIGGRTTYSCREHQR
jgi:formamidopyrimidine-DNA glycosylase